MGNSFVRSDCRLLTSLCDCRPARLLLACQLLYCWLVADLEYSCASSLDHVSMTHWSARQHTRCLALAQPTQRATSATRYWLAAARLCSHGDTHLIRSSLLLCPCVRWWVQGPGRLLRLLCGRARDGAERLRLHHQQTGRRARRTARTHSAQRRLPHAGTLHCHQHGSARRQVTATAQHTRPSS